MADTTWLNDIKNMVGKQYGKVYAWDHVNPAMIRQWCEVMGVTNPLYTDESFANDTEFGGIVAPPTMLQAWCMEGLHMNNYPPGSTDENPYQALKLFEAQGFEAVVAVNSDLHFDRYVSLGEKLYYTTQLTDVGDEKVTALGTGYFVTLTLSFFAEQVDGDEPVGNLLFRVFKFKPHKKPEPVTTDSNDSAVPKILRSKPVISNDNAFFWDGVEQGELRIQQCNRCEKLQHPPGPICSHCQHLEMGYIKASGKGHIYSFVIMHYPEVPPFDYPNPIGLIELDEGVRIVAQLTGIKRDDIRIGKAVQVTFEKFDGDLTLPLFTAAQN
ncbi:bifunctional MaoC family dehydratase N-terminal/OB-fold nucleic acid binding domain-containing protein [Thalassotalea ponticola]|uniref:bifunctional MaoC family dehydratase N-terminal/OB-fold nucleic acid binding domain-containing protein n=1 Tax=Thalassotalea ponticola TaxID=1523392 RepID=UPI0025B2FCF2|nr:bifunctional MaoC family dehydratase N-terminal/OB-fold nucleic acid binding domain-containing protein [Thalassotalea ponticola]MDN3653449.1 bifunctional MaoC family dehydratase N-terminal/OB-fold nucleic acid binding domain-containing protein [Thalassotalea ponticola]